MGIMTEVTNSATGKRYFISTVKVGNAWQIAVFRKIFGPLANFWWPAFRLDGVQASRTSVQHKRVEAIVRDVSPSNWEKSKGALLIEDARACGDIPEVSAPSPFVKDQNGDPTLGVYVDLPLLQGWIAPHIAEELAGFAGPPSGDSLETWLRRAGQLAGEHFEEYLEYTNMVLAKYCKMR
jgi:hypothetical protein